MLHPGEAIKLTSSELKPKKITPTMTNPDRLVYFLVSGAPKFGDLKLKKVLPLESPSQEQQLQQHGWSKVNDIYLEKSGVREFTQLDLDNGNVWYEPYNDIDAISNVESSSSSSFKRPCRNRTSSDNSNNNNNDDEDYEYNGVQSAIFCDELDATTTTDSDVDGIVDDQISNGGGGGFDSNQQQAARYDHCMFEVNIDTFILRVSII